MLSHALRAKVQNTATPVPTDPNFKQVSLLLHGDGTNGAQNNTFLDSSTNNFTVTRNGNTTQGTNTPFSQAAGYWSNYNPANSTYLTATGSAIDFGTGDFTVEAWVYPTTMQTYNFPIASTGSNNYFGFASTGYLTCYATSAGSDRYQTSGTAVTVNQWNHIAFTRSSGTLYFFVNGSLVGTFASWTYSISSTTAATIGASTTYASYGFIGYMSNVRLVKGTAVYTSAFTPPTTPLTAITNTSLLTCQSNYFKDNSSNNFALTVTGTPSVQPFSPYAPTAAYSTSVNGGSIQFDGTGDYLSVADNANLQFGTSAFTIQSWVYRNAAGTAHSIVSKGGASTGFTLGITSTNVLRFTNTTTNIDTTTTIPANAWTHVAAVRTNTSANGFKLYINGVSSATSTVATNFNQTSTLYVGADRSASTVMNGYIADLRYVNGTAETITVPTAPLTAITNTQLLLSGTNAGIVDNATKNDLETVGNAQVSTSVVKYGTGSMSFDGTGDWLTSPDTPNLQLGTGNFTIEGWVYLNAVGTARGFVSKGTSTTGWSLGTNSSNQVVFSYTSSSITSTGTLSVSTWYFVTVVRSGTGTNLTKIYIDGTNDGTGTVATDFTQTSIMYVGADRVGGSALNGYIDDLRITKGVARYTANFTPPTSAFPNQ